ncbi:OmpA family protein [Agarivorans sp. TSD2052]|uniref:OmpA family protein n=1 Tax=Agarivorans sp. TSD2052 TaxID=2937286 RepID=UPI00201028F0|nr:OmpA family protein [Agarivorans sp. TSD2052]UPW16994.1 OmpA family protein [Agarivorans sp. TSD2052]
MRSIIISLLLLMTSACSSWPEQGRGGFAEHQLGLLAWLDGDTGTADLRELGPEHGLHFESVLVKHQLDLLILEGAELCFPASVTQARMQQQRIVRELEGGLTFDAANDLEIQQHFVNMLEQRLDRVTESGACQTDRLGHIQSSHLMVSISDALNSNNQFAFDSSELTPAYKDQLTNLTPIIAASKVALIITGHSDSKGDDEYKQRLSLARAQAVADYMTELGMNEQQIKLAAVADSQPYSEGETDAIRHSNRRVTISVIDAETNIFAQRFESAQ